MLKLELQLKNSQLFQIQDHQTSGFTHQAAGLFHVGHTQHLITQNQAPTRKTDKLLILHTDLDQSKVLLVKMLPRLVTILSLLWDSEK